MKPLTWLIHTLSVLHSRYQRRRRIGHGDALYRLELEDFAGAGRRMTMMALIRAHARVVRLDDGSVLCRVLGRYPMVVDGADLGISARLMLEGYWEYSVVSFMARHLHPGQVAIDVGANLGFFTVQMADLVGAAGRVEAIEPNPALARLAERNLILNGVSPWSRVHGAAVTDQGGETRLLRFDAVDSKNGHLLPPGVIRGASAQGSMVEIEVPTITLDDLVPGSADFVKVDVEGAEEAVWAGMQRLLDRSPDVLLLLEFNVERCADPAALLHSIAARFPLRQLTTSAQVTPVTMEAVLAKQGDTQLVLTSRPLGASRARGR